MIETPESDVRSRQRVLRRVLEEKGLDDARVLDVIESIRRDRFVPEAYRESAYQDTALPLAEGQTVSQPYIVAHMTSLLQLRGDETVLEIGTGSGYQTAVLARLATRVVTIERRPSLAAAARARLAESGIENVEFHVGDGTLGWPAAAPYDGVLVTAAAPAIPEPLFEQLRTGGRIVVPVGDESLQRLLVVERTENGREVDSACGCRFVKLIGEHGWAEE